MKEMKFDFLWFLFRLDSRSHMLWDTNFRIMLCRTDPKMFVWSSLFSPIFNGFRAYRIFNASSIFLFHVCLCECEDIFVCAFTTGIFISIIIHISFPISFGYSKCLENVVCFSLDNLHFAGIQVWFCCSHSVFENDIIFVVVSVVLSM